MRTTAFGLFLLAVLGLAPSRASAQVDPQPELSLYYRNLTAARLNPLGLFNLFESSFRVRLFESDSDALKQNFAGIGVTTGLSPAFGRIGPMIEVQPLTLLRLWAAYEFIGYFSTFDLMASFPSATSEFSDTAIDAQAMAGRGGYATWGSLLSLGANAQAKVGPIAVRNGIRFARASFDLRDGDRVYYDQFFDMQVPNDGWLVTNDLDVLYVSDFGLVVGARYTFSTPFNEDSHFEPGEDRTPAENHIHRVGPLIAYTLERNPGGLFDAPTILLIAQWHLVHRFRTGQDVTTGLPYLAIGFQFNGDFLSDH